MDSLNENFMIDPSTCLAFIYIATVEYVSTLWMVHLGDVSHDLPADPFILKLAFLSLIGD